MVVGCLTHLPEIVTPPLMRFLYFASWGKTRIECQNAIEKAAQWALKCSNPDGGFGHFPGCSSDADAVYFQVGTLVISGFLKPGATKSNDSHLLSWGHLMSAPKVAISK